MNELIVWGLVANVGGFTFAFIAFAALVRYVREGHRLHCLLAIGAASMALYANTRSGIAVATGAAAIVLVTVLDRLVFERGDRGVPLRAVVGRVALVGAVSALLTAPLLVSMLRYADYYYFVHYMEYADFRALWDQTLASVSRPLFAVAVAGLLVAVVIRRLVLLRVVAVAFILYVLLTIAFSWGGLDQEIIQQLETPRLMPFQRLLVVYLAAATIGIGLDLAARRLPRYRHAIVAAALVVGSVVAIASYDGEYGEIPADHRMASSPTIGVAELAQFSAIVAEANEVVPTGSAIYVIGDQESWWHQQLWAPTWSDAPFYYDDWMWYWHEEVAEQCNTNAGHFTPNPARTLTEEWLREHGIGALVVTDMTNPIDLCGGENPRAVAAGSPFLERQQTIGYWDLYLVRDAGALVTNGDIQPEAMTFDSGEITATFGDASGEIQVRHNWFARWQAWADGNRVDVVRADDDTMRIEVPEGTQVVELRYVVTGADWLARMLAVAGVGASLAIAVPPLARRATPRSPTVP